MKENRFEFNVKLSRYLNDIHKQRAMIIEDFAKAYLADTELRPSQVQLVAQDMGDRWIYRFEKIADIAE